MKIIVEDMVQTDIGQVVEVDRECYPLPWPPSAYKRELGNNHHARYIVLRELPEAGSTIIQADGERKSWRTVLGWSRNNGSSESIARGRIVGYAGMWLVSDEAHVTTIAVRDERRGQGFGELLLASLIGMAFQLDIRWVTLEVRVSNEVARRLYRKYGFRDAGLRKRYYSDNNEDALVMTTDDISLNGYQERLSQLTSALALKVNDPPTMETTAAVLSGPIHHASSLGALEPEPSS